MYVDEFKNNEDIAEEYAEYGDKADKARILKLLNESTVYVAYYSASGYDGTSLVIYENNGKLYEVNASHCSCYALEGQWDPEETRWKAIGMREHRHRAYDENLSVKQHIDKLVKELS